jgi:hypothetical protein
MIVMVVTIISCKPSGGPPTNMTVRVANERAQTADFAWQSGGLFGTPILASTGNDAIAGCSVYMRTFDSRSTNVTISIGIESAHFDLGASPGNGNERDFVIGLTDVLEVQPDNLPTSPCG